MIKTGVEFKGTLILKRIEIPQVRKFGREGKGRFPSGLTIEDLHVIPMTVEGTGKIGQAEGLGPDGGPVKIPDRGLD
jgi:hypothetical protein